MPILAMEKSGIPYKHIFATERDDYVREFIQKNYSPENVYADVRHRPCDPQHNLDIFITGVPCTDFSPASKGLRQKGKQVEC